MIRVVLYVLASIVLVYLLATMLHILPGPPMPALPRIPLGLVLLALISGVIGGILGSLFGPRAPADADNSLLKLEIRKLRKEFEEDRSIRAAQNRRSAAEERHPGYSSAPPERSYFQNHERPKEIREAKIVPNPEPEPRQSRERLVEQYRKAGH